MKKLFNKIIKEKNFKNNSEQIYDNKKYLKKVRKKKTKTLTR